MSDAPFHPEAAKRFAEMEALAAWFDRWIAQNTNTKTKTEWCPYCHRRMKKRA